MIKKRVWSPISLLLVLVLLLVAFGCAQSSPTSTTAQATTKTLTVGLSASMSGSGAAWGQVYDRTLTLALEDVNSKGGVTADGTKYLLTHKVYDHAYDPSKATENANRLIQVDKVAWIVTHGATATKPIIPITEAKGVIVSHGATGRDIMTFQAQKYTFTHLMLAPEMMQCYWTWLVKSRPNIKTVTIMEPDDASGWDEAKDIAAIAKTFGIKKNDDAYFSRTTTDFYPVLTKVLAANPDLIDFGSSTPPASQGLILKQARELGYKGQVIGFVTSLQTVLTTAGAAADGLIYGGTMDPTSSLAKPEEKALYDSWVRAFGLPFDYLSIGIVNSIYPVVAAMNATGSTNSDKVASYMSTHDVTVLGRKVRFGGAAIYGEPARKVVYPVAIWTVEGGKVKVLDVVEMPSDY